MYPSARNSKSCSITAAILLGPSWLYRQTDRDIALNPTQGWARVQHVTHSLLATRQASIVIRGDRYVDVPELVRAVWGAGARNGLLLDDSGPGANRVSFGGLVASSGIRVRASWGRREDAGSLLGMFVDDIRWKYLSIYAVLLGMAVPGILT